MSDNQMPPPPVGSVWRTKRGGFYIVKCNRIAPAQAGWHVWVFYRNSPFSQKEWEKMGLTFVKGQKGNA
jgi:hypothetical protein